MLLGHRVLDWTLSTAGLLVMFLGVYDVIQNREENNSINDKYGLYLYSEYSKREMDSKVPVLFIPGNAGSYKQVRSLASVALRMAIDKKFSFEFDFYSIDFHEEFSALYGGFLDQQVDFTYECLDFITKKYPQNTGIIIIGHSVGGLIGRTSWIYFYRRLPYIDPKVSYINIGGGVRDIQVRSGLASFEFADVDVILSSSPGIWVSADHRCIVWCKQLIIAINRALFEVVHQGIIKDRESITSSFKYHLEKRNYFFKSSKLAEEQTTRSLSYHVSSSPVNLFELVNVLPGKRRSAVHLPLNTNQFSHYAIVIKKGSESPKINVDVYESSHRVLSVESTNIKDYLGLPFILKAKTDPAASFYNITFPDLTSPWKAYEIVVYPQGHCETNKDILGSMHFVNSESKESHALDNSNLYVFLLYIAMGCALLFSGIAWLLIIVGGNALSKSLSAWTVIPEFVADYALEYVWRLSPLIFPVLGAIAFTTCGSFVITLGLLLHVLKFV
ncbi:PGAP1 [Lepeophtheirus salmonis]|uniref:GPI inositol-deacylase n=1 Tax=Lepeophtheirus salmonis TaxID=72036 RepID=A0A7R8D918_LEPSM|nr:PGAP1 [Lepeophtheirus salmonis]CAF3041006.1 PGAP1 [Lepeophtheirus salmonis]